MTSPCATAPPVGPATDTTTVDRVRVIGAYAVLFLAGVVVYGEVFRWLVDVSLTDTLDTLGSDGDVEAFALGFGYGATTAMLAVVLVVALGFVLFELVSCVKSLREARR